MALPDDAMQTEDRTGLRQQVADAYLSGMTQQQVGAKFGIHIQTVRAYLREGGVGARSRRFTMTEADQAEARRLSATGVGTRTLGRLFGVSHTTMAKVLRTAVSSDVSTTMPSCTSPQLPDPARLASILGHVDPRVDQLYQAWQSISHEVAAARSAETLGGNQR